jgi:hypothetical protein
MKRKFFESFFDWKFILFFVLLVLVSNFLLIYSQCVEKEIKNDFQHYFKKIRRTQPVYTKGIYLTSWTASDLNKIKKIIDLIYQAKLNTVVIDIKDSFGKVAYDSKIPLVNKRKTKEIRIKNIKTLLEKFHLHGIYTIARIVVFQDSELANKRPDLALKNRLTGKIWKDYKGLSWVDPASKDVWEYNVSLAKEAFELGFDEVNFDYVRFPSDGNINQIVYPIWDKNTKKSEIIRRFFEYQKVQLERYGPRSVDLFGLTLWHLNDDNDMNIGQRFIDALPYFNYICPMVYPSHYPINFEGYKNPAEHPYEIIYKSLIKAKEYLEKQNIQKVFIRPWLQAFNLGAYYNEEMLIKEIRAAQDSSSYGWIFWNAKNDYSNLISTLKNYEIQKREN